MTIKVGSRGSLLALTQTKAAIAQLERLRPDCRFEVVIIKTAGDVAKTLMPVGDTVGLFVKELEEALLANTIDCAVHSLKDVPVRQPNGLTLAAILEREDPRDALVSAHGSLFKDLPAGAVVGTSSPRRKFQLQAWRPDLVYRDIKGNVDTRLSKVDKGDYRATVLACAGMNRLGFSARITERFSQDQMISAPGQGAVAVEIRQDDRVAREIVGLLHHAPTADAVRAERACLAGLGGGCRMPIGAWAESTPEGLSLRGVLATEDGSRMVKHRLPPSQVTPEVAGATLAEALQQALQRVA